MSPERFYVYAIELDKRDIYGRRAPSAYVGSSALHPQARFRRHKTGALGTSRHVRRHGVRLLPQLYGHLNPFASREGAKAAEKQLRAELERRGYRVYGSCYPRENGCFF